MQISGLVVAFEPDISAIQSAITTLRQAGPFTVGELSGRRLSVVMEAATPEDALQWHRWLCELPGVLDVSIAYVSVASDAEELVQGALS